ncbi:WD40-repeat-containing domain protein [Jimgerdemannia flammicorona]|uniref:WD40-repeat-containing domain protein n=1 Tax=Jimgerdemannia flammicorona TaxID=994334 RepID=A0A433QRB4_9FUNG|nr:WD40-repeat-containing domain protein [Jimgerdemannia flammicorona]
MTHQHEPEEDVNLEVDEEEYIEAGDIDEEHTLNEGVDAIHMDDDEDEEDGTFGGFHGTRPVEGDDDMVEVVDDSVQGFFAHKEPVYSVGMHPTDENIIVTGGGDDKSYLWRADTGDQMFELTGHTDSVTAVGFNTTGEYVASGGMDGKVKVWKVATGELLATVDGPDEIVWLNWHSKGNILLAGATDSTIWMWGMPSGKFMNVFSGHSASVTAGLFTPDGKKIVSVSGDGSLIVWDPKTASAMVKLTSDDQRFHQEPINVVSVHKDSVLALTGSADASARLVNLNTGTIVASFENHADSVETVGFSSVLPLAATGAVDGKLNIWDVTTMRLRQTCQHSVCAPFWMLRLCSNWLTDTQRTESLKFLLLGCRCQASMARQLAAYYELLRRPDGEAMGWADRQLREDVDGTPGCTFGFRNVSGWSNGSDGFGRWNVVKFAQYNCKEKDVWDGFT